MQLKHSNIQIQWRKDAILKRSSHWSEVYFIHICKNIEVPNSKIQEKRYLNFLLYVTTQKKTQSKQLQQFCKTSNFTYTSNSRNAEASSSWQAPQKCILPNQNIRKPIVHSPRAVMIHFQNASLKSPSRIPSIIKRKKKKSDAKLPARFELFTYRIRIIYIYYVLCNLFNKYIYFNSHDTVYPQGNCRNGR